MKELGEDMADEDIENMMADADVNGDGYVCYEGKCYSWSETLSISK